ncbi:MAG TPA: cytochrome P460 family protein [Acetobacteraceae bacterium]|nr:cytochrome P460 family protein [Acetobacteraceae bacterium]
MLHRLRVGLPGFIAGLFACIAAFALPVRAASLCADEQSEPQVPKDLALCAKLDPIVRKPGALPLDQYETALNTYVSAMCHRNTAAGWQMDKTVRDTGPFIATLSGGAWSGSYNGTHAPVLIWYSPEMMAWLHANRPSDPAKTPAHLAPIPDGAMMVKEMYSPPPASACRIPDLLRLRPNTQGMAVMVRDSAAAVDGWFWAAVGWKGWTPDWPPPASNSLALAGFGQYCLNCHASAADNQTFASLSNIKGEPGTFLNFLSEDFFQQQSSQIVTRFSHVLVHQRQRREAEAKVVQLPGIASLAFLRALRPPFAAVLSAPAALDLPSQSYDHTWIPGGGPNPHSAFVTSDQCVGCHTAGGTGLQYEMTTPSADGTVLNLSPYGTWRTSPMGLAGRDPIFFAQLASETQTFHAALSPKVQDTCLGCHGILGQRQAAIDSPPTAPCPDFLRATLNAVPYPDNNPTAPLAPFGALGRDGVSCMSCHHMVLGKAETAKYQDAPQNRCVAQRQDFLNPENVGFARTFTGSFFVGATDRLAGPFKDPKQVPMQHALGITPEDGATVIKSAELCGTCHTVHLPVLRDAQTLGYSYEQTTYPEWAFSAYRTGDTPDGKLPSGAGTLAESCQGCHMQTTDSTGKPFRSKIASIQENSTFPQVDNGLPAKDIDLPVRDGFARHTLVGLNVFLIDMAQQFSEMLGIAVQDPMLGSMGVPPLDLTKQAMFQQAANSTATVGVSAVQVTNGTLSATVTVTNKSGHKFPSGVGFRRAFIDFRVLDADGNVLWESGRTDRAGVIVDQHGQPVAGELWWKPDCSGLINPDSNPHQPHYEVISHQDEAQIYQELVTAPPVTGVAQCGPMAKPTGRLTTSFLSICAKLKDNRLLPKGFLPLAQRIAIAKALGAGADMAEDTNAVGVDGDPDYGNGSGGDTLRYQVSLADVSGKPATVEARLYDQATPPFFLQDRFCTAQGSDRDRLAYIASTLNLSQSPAQDWKLFLVSSGTVAVPQ